MKRILALLISIVAFSFAFAATASADAMQSASAATPDSFQGSVNAPNAWIGKTAVDLLTNLGSPTYTEETQTGKTLAYVKHMIVGSNSSETIEQDFAIGQNGQITAVHTSHL